MILVGGRSVRTLGKSMILVGRRSVRTFVNIDGGTSVMVIRVGSLVSIDWGTSMVV